MISEEIERLISRAKSEGLTKPFLDYHNTNLIDKINKKLTTPSKEINNVCQKVTKMSISYLSGNMTREKYTTFIQDIKDIDNIIREYSQDILAIREQFEPEELKELIDKSKDYFMFA